MVLVKSHGGSIFPYLDILAEPAQTPPRCCRLFYAISKRCKTESSAWLWWACPTGTNGGGSGSSGSRKPGSLFQPGITVTRR
ncbi:MAG: hypothetical protein K0Q90_2894 [Paenibacillaceae bacterium]|jgi:hypothetical protein|nr:hypothetical protein [Paenibacillaceae bacterium]